ncbi:hypothetical protein KTU01_08320 [Kocuria turfanensis]|uniref:Uncharacterized protein n=1 Tax=Kocuria turfanensis TaxID=388357 RepID=A0A512IAJ2_9MICC|nr:hypothetical protein KTU01_08320 [Kocuria turfanensis]
MQATEAATSTSAIRRSRLFRSLPRVSINRRTTNKTAAGSRSSADPMCRLWAGSPRLSASNPCAPVSAAPPVLSEPLLRPTCAPVLRTGTARSQSTACPLGERCPEGPKLDW